jgi:hypothetical protein
VITLLWPSRVGWRKLYNEEPHVIYCSPYIIRGDLIEVYERGRAYGGHGEKRIEYKIWWGTLIATDLL